MKIITEIKVLETDKDFCEIAHMAYSPMVSMPIGSDVVSTSCVRELIKGRRFINQERGLDIVLGVSQEVGEILGLQYDAFENISMLNDSLQIEKTRLANKLEKISELGFLERLKCLFCGIDINEY
jgi:hypothetical protein